MVINSKVLRFKVQKRMEIKYKLAKVLKVAQVKRSNRHLFG